MEKFIVCTRAGRWKSAFWGERGGFVLLFWDFLMLLYIIWGVMRVSQEGNDPALPCLELLPNQGARWQCGAAHPGARRCQGGEKVREAP